MDHPNKAIVELSEVFKKAVLDNSLGMYLKDSGSQRAVGFTLVWASPATNIYATSELGFVLIHAHVGVWDPKTSITKMLDEMPEDAGGVSEEDIKMISSFGRDAASLAFKDTRWITTAEVRSNVVVGALSDSPVTLLRVVVLPAPHLH